VKGHGGKAPPRGADAEQGFAMLEGSPSDCGHLPAVEGVTRFSYRAGIKPGRSSSGSADQETQRGGLSVVCANTPGGHTCSVLAGGSRALLDGASAPAPGPRYDAGNAAGPSRRDSRERPAPDDDDDMTLVLAVTVGATAAAFVLGGVGYVLWLLAQQPAVVLERVAAVVTLAVGFGAMVLGMERGR